MRPFSVQGVWKSIVEGSMLGIHELSIILPVALTVCFIWRLLDPLQRLLR